MAAVSEVHARHRAPRGQGDLLREQLLDAAEALLVEKGHPEAVSVRAVTRAAGCTPAAMYLHFADKDELLFHASYRRFEEFESAIRASLGFDESVRDRMIRMGRAYVDYGVAHPEAYRILFATQCVVPDDVEVATLPGMRALGHLVNTIQEGIKAGEFVPGDPLVHALGIWATTHGLVMLILDSPEFVEIPDELIEAACVRAMDGLTVR